MIAATLVVAAFVCLPAGAGAAAHHYWLPGGRATRVELEGSNGYLIRISSNEHRRLIMWVMKEGISTEYEVQGARAEGDGIDAKLPGLGSISVHFHQRGPARHASPYTDCDGPRPTLRRGVVRGVIEFIGERDYTRVESNSAGAEVEEWARQRCRYGTPHRSKHRRSWTNAFKAWEEGAAPDVYFSATKYRPDAVKHGQVVFHAEMSSSQDDLFIRRSATVVAPASAFQIPEPDTYPEHIILTPPAPFTGTGTFARTPESVFTWEGDLAVQFPGADPVPLVGPSFEPHYCALRGCVYQDVESGPGTG